MELLTGCVIVSIALLGVYSIFREYMQTERRLSIRWQDGQAAEAIVAHASETLESVVKIPSLKAISMGKENDGRIFVECLTYGNPAQATLERRRYCWDSNSGEDISLRTIPYSGTQAVAVWAISDQDPWAGIEPIVIGRRIRHFSIRFKKVGSSKWKDRVPKDSSSIARVRATVGNSTVERIVSIPLSGEMK